MHRSVTGLVAALLSMQLALVACGGSTPSTERSPGGLARGTAWRDYVGAQPVGGSCTVTVVRTPPVGLLVSVTREIASRTGDRVTETVDSTVRLATGITNDPSMRSFVNTAAGQVDDLPTTLPAIAVTPGGPMLPNPALGLTDVVGQQQSGDVVIPTVASLRAGASLSSTVMITLAEPVDGVVDPTAGPPAPDPLALLTVDGQDRATIAVTTTISPLPVSSARTPSGTYDDVIGFHEVVTSVTSTDFPAGSTFLAAYARGREAVSYDVVYARSVGIVQETEHRAAAVSVLQLTSCTSPRP